MSQTIFADAIQHVSYANGVLRVTLSRQDGQNGQETAGTLLLPIGQAGQFANSLTTALRQLDEKMRAQQQARSEETQAPAQDAPAPAEGDAGDALTFDR